MKIVVIGAGIAGLGVGTYLSRQGHDVKILEATGRIGGRAISHRKDQNTVVDIGTQFYHSNYRRALKLIDETGLTPTLRKVTGRVRVFQEDPQGKSFLLNPRYPWYGSLGILGNLKIGFYLLSKLIAMPGDVFTETPDKVRDLLDCSGEITQQHIKNTILRPLALIGTLSEPEILDISGLHLLRLIRVILTSNFMVLVNGIDSLHTALGYKLDVEVNSPVNTLSIENNKVVVNKELHTETVTAEHVVVATTPDRAAELIPENWSIAHKFLKGINAPQFTLPTFYLNRPLEKNVWAYLTHEVPGCKISYITDATQKCQDMVNRVNSVIQPWVCFPNSKELVSLSDEEITKRCLNDLEKLFPGFSSWIEDILITHHPFSVPNHGPGHQHEVTDFLADNQLKPVSFCGDYLFGGYMEAALSSAQLTTDKIARL